MNLTIENLPLFVYGGMLLFVLVTVQVLGGLQVIKMPIKWHKWLGISILGIAAVHGTLALIYFLG